MPLVVKLNSRLEVTEATVITAKMRASRPDGISRLRGRAPCRRQPARPARPARTRCPHAIASSAGTDEGRAPAGVLDEQAGDHRRERDAEIAGEAVDADREARAAAAPRTSIGMPTGW